MYIATYCNHSRTHLQASRTCNCQKQYRSCFSAGLGYPCEYYYKTSCNPFTNGLCCMLCLMTYQLVIWIESKACKHLDQYSYDNNDVVVFQNQICTDTVTLPSDVYPDSNWMFPWGTKQRYITWILPHTWVDGWMSSSTMPSTHGHGRDTLRPWHTYTHDARAHNARTRCTWENKLLKFFLIIKF